MIKQNYRSRSDEEKIDVFLDFLEKRRHYFRQWESEKFWRNKIAESGSCEMRYEDEEV